MMARRTEQEIKKDLVTLKHEHQRMIDVGFLDIAKEVDKDIKALELKLQPSKESKK